jgi:dihydrofolate reductase
MRRLVVTEYVTVDGVMEDPGGGEKGGHGGWSFQFWSEEAFSFKFSELFAADAMLLGRVTYEGFAKAWPAMKDDMGFADRMNGMRKYVVSTTLEETDWNNSTLIRGNVAEEVAALKDQPGQDILVAGSAQLVRALMQHDLVDEYRLMVHPIVVGGGKRLFPDGVGRRALTLVETKPFQSGIVVLYYRPAGAEAA